MQLAFSEKHSSHGTMQQLLATTKSLTFWPLSIAKYSFIQLSQLGRQWGEKCPIFETVGKGDSNPGSLDCESGILPLSYRAPQLSLGEKPTYSFSLGAYCLYLCIKIKHVYDYGFCSSTLNKAGTLLVRDTPVVGVLSLGLG